MNEFEISEHWPGRANKQVNLQTFTHNILTSQSWNLFFSPEDTSKLNDKLVEVSASKMGLQMKLDELEAAEVNIKVSHKV